MTHPLPTVVVVDDAGDVRALVRARLRLSGQFTVVGEGSTGTDAISLAREHLPALMVLDVSMPGMDGLEALPLVLEASPGTQVVLYSGFEEQGLADRGRALGAAGFLAKSTPVERLADDLATVLAGSTAGASTRPDDTDQERRVLVEHSERFREVFEEAAIGMATMTLSGRVVRANKALALLLERSADELIGVSYPELASTGGGDVAAAVRDLVAGRAEAVRVHHGLDGRGDRRLVHVTLAAVRDGRRQPLYLSLQAQDVTEQHRVDEELRQSEERFRLLVDAVEDYAIFMLDPQGRVASWNTGAQRIKGYSAQEALGRHFRMFYPLEIQQSGHPEFELEMALRNGHYEEEGRRVRKDGSTFWANVVITAVRNPAGEHVGFAKITRDVTERHRTLQERQRSADALGVANAELEAANRRLARAAADQSQFLAVVAHELRGPVGVLAGSAGTLARFWSELTEDERREMFDAMTGSAARMQRLLGDLLTAARLESGAVELAPSTVQVGELLERAVAAARQVHADMVVEVECPDDLRLAADADRLSQAVDNLLTNALRHGAPPVRLGAIRSVDSVQIRVFDGGAGVPPDIRGSLFERFATGERKVGTGLGLFIVRELARAHGGDAWYEPPDAEQPGAQHCFVLSLPCPAVA